MALQRSAGRLELLQMLETRWPLCGYGKRVTPASSDLCWTPWWIVMDDLLILVKHECVGIKSDVM